jgi:low temperature requirement protein LtrA
VAIGVGAADLPLSAPVLLAVVLGLLISLVLWWTYFDVVALVAERVLSRSEGEARAKLARDSYTYLHFPMVLGIVYLALGLKKVVSYVADTEHHALSDPLTVLPLVAMYGGVVIYLYAHIAFRYRNVRSLNKQRAVVATGLLVLLPFMTRVPALAALATLTAVLVALIIYEANRFAAARHAVRHGHAADIMRPGGTSNEPG